MNRQPVKPTSTRTDALPSAGRWYYLPLVLLAALVVAATLVGVIRQGDTESPPAVPGPVTAEVTLPSDAESAGDPNPDPGPAGAESTADALSADNGSLPGVTTGSAPANATGLAAAQQLPTQCRPSLNQGLQGQPWLDPSRSGASEAAFSSAIADHQPGYVQGAGGWAFFDDIQVNDLSQSIGRLTLDAAQNRAWGDYLSSLDRLTAANGSDLFIVVAPAKWDVVPAELPQWAQDLRGTVSLDLLLAAHPELPFIDIRSELRAQSSANSTYSPLNSHWTRFGGYVGWSAITECMRASSSTYESLTVPEITGVEKIPDANEYQSAGVEMTQELGSARPIYVNPPVITTVTSLVDGSVLPSDPENVVDMGLLPVRTDSPGAQSDLTLLVLRDSMGNSLSPLWSESFRSTFQYQHGIGGVGPTPDMPALLAEHRPDVTLLVLTERYLAYPAPSPVG